MDNPTWDEQEPEEEEKRSREPVDLPRARLITIEPALFLLTFAVTMTGPVLQNFIVMKTCEVTLHYNFSVCDNLSNLKPIEDQIQPYSVQLIMYKSLIEAIIPAALSFFLGPWSDHNGRKPLLMIPTIGYMLLNAIYMVLSMNFAWESSPNFLLIASIPVAMTGGFVAFVTGAFCYLSDISTPAERSWRMGVAEAALLLGLPTGLASSSYLLKFGGYVMVFATCSCACLLALLYVIYFVPESIQTSESTRQSVFDVRLIKEMVATCWKPRSGYRRLTMFLVMGTMASIIFSLDGDISVSYLYTRERFGWEIQDFTLYSSASVLASTVGSLIGLHLFSRTLKLEDAPLAAFACLLKAVSLMVLALASMSWMMYAGSAIGILGGLSSPLCRAILSKSVHADDVGKVFSLASSLEALTPIAAAPLYTIIYKATFLTVPGAFYMLSSGLYVANFVFLVVVAVVFYKYPASSYAQIGAGLEVN
ncbi:lysosomal proton-coupled steroid conjugate and bile acid symporter SLC46A3-like [Neocloeon triangulifer]|uniref:lysosomal proton-coupled steroid conjugate and bile acid symporter SLC46A3-like n=1 Tax=Neocloeon triangulifer TaxID=2078957 RepID=UPI00286F0877|nr:lysosomal proton-coupled steroid conjugate and bile acid symporter SLC46A3-like [Neocloeon triangulifer]